jgi:hypothetical protein
VFFVFHNTKNIINFRRDCWVIGRYKNDLKKFFKKFCKGLAGWGSTVVEHLTHNPKVNGSNSAKKFFINLRFSQTVFVIPTLDLSSHFRVQLFPQLSCLQ